MIKTHSLTKYSSKKQDNKRYFYKGNELYDIKFIESSFLGHDLEAYWNDKDNNNQKNRGKFYLKNLEVVN